MPSPRVQSKSRLEYPTILVARDVGLDSSLIDPLRQGGFHVLEAEGWEHVIEKFKTHSRPIHLLLVDESMSARVEILRMYRSELQVMLVKKPVDADEVLARIRQLLGPPPSSLRPVLTAQLEKQESVHDYLRHRDVEKARLNIIMTGLDLCLTFAKNADICYRFGYWEHSERALASAEKGYWDMLRFFSQARQLTGEIEMEMKSKFINLRERLDGRCDTTTGRAVAAQAT